MWYTMRTNKMDHRQAAAERYKRRTSTAFPLGKHRHDMLPGMCNPVNNSTVFTAENAFNTDETHEWQQKWVTMKQKAYDETGTIPVIFVKIGRFYEVFHNDADALHEYMSAPYMKGAIAHTGFPETSLSKFKETIEEAGIKVVKIITDLK